MPDWVKQFLDEWLAAAELSRSRVYSDRRIAGWLRQPRANLFRRGAVTQRENGIHDFPLAACQEGAKISLGIVVIPRESCECDSCRIL